MKKKRHVPLDSFEKATSHQRICDKVGCDKTGEFRAPQSTSQLNAYYWFCMDHVREYNKSWDYYKGMSPEEIEESRISDMTWNRPSWPVGAWRTLLDNVKYLDDFNSFLKAKAPPLSIPKPIQKALNVLELNMPLTNETLKKQYKKLAKQYHPDLNPNDQEAEERLKKINESYQVLKKFLSV